jgi:hypothetical protein
MRWRRSRARTEASKTSPASKAAAVPVNMTGFSAPGPQQLKLVEEHHRLEARQKIAAEFKTELKASLETAKAGPITDRKGPMMAVKDHMTMMTARGPADMRLRNKKKKFSLFGF